MATKIDLGKLGLTMLRAAAVARVGVTVAFFEGLQPRTVYVSDCAAEITGWSVDELVGTDPFERTAPEDFAHVAEQVASLARGEAPHATFRIAVLRKDGGRASVEIATSAETIEGRPALVSFIVDVSARRTAEEERGRNDARFRELIEMAPEPIGILRDGHFIYANPAYVRTLGFSDAAALYASSSHALVAKEDEAACASREALVLQGHRQLPYTYRVKRGDGADILLEVSSVYFEYQGKPSFLCMGRDVTARRQLEEQLVLNDRLAALGTLAAGVAHEINNPLAYLMLNLEWVAHNLPRIASEPDGIRDLLAMLEEAQQGATRVSTIVRDLRSFSRADGDTQRSVDVAAVVRSAIKISGHEIRRYARVVTTFEPAGPVWANESRLEQVVVNLLLNASQSMDEANAVHNEIRVTVRGTVDGQTVLEVGDNGAGIPAEVLPRIFDPFFTTKPVGVGTGLGLSICHGIVTSLGGQITVHPGTPSGETIGTTFRITLQTADKAAPADKGDPPTLKSLSSGVRARVLIVDDEAPIASLLRELLGREHDVVTAASGPEALSVLSSGQQFDVIFCDLVMPGLSGIDLYERIRADSPGLARRVVFMTGGGFSARSLEFLSKIGNRRIEKPFSLGVVEEITREMAALRLDATDT